MRTVDTFSLREATVNRMGWAIEPHILASCNIDMLRRRAVIERALYIKEMIL